MVVALFSAYALAQSSGTDALLRVPPAERIAAPAYGATLRIDLVANKESLGPEGGCVPISQSEVDAVYSLGQKLVAGGLASGMTVTEKVILHTADRAVLQSTVHAADGSPLVIVRNYLDEDRTRCNQVLARSAVLFAGAEAGKAVWLYWDRLGGAE